MDETRRIEPKTSLKPRTKETICEECRANPWKYKCPGCSIRSCSLPCVKSHKTRTGCTGKRDVTRFVPLSQFDDNLLLSDYNMLEEVKRIAESAQRMRTRLSRYPYFKIPFYLRSVRSAAASRRTKLLFLPSGMSKREKNQTRYDQRKKSISWTIEWRFHSTDVSLIDHGISEDTSLLSILENHLKPGPWNHKLKQFCDVPLDSLKFFIRKYPKGAKSPFRELDIKAPLRHQLANIIILEYPIIHIFLPSHNYDFEVVRDVNPVNTQPKPNKSSNNAPESPKGVTFREEEFEEDDISSFEPKVLDLIKQVNFEKGLNGSSDGCLQVRSTACGNSNPGFGTVEQEGGGKMELEFEQGLVDTYSDLFAGMNGDFFDFDGEFVKEVLRDEELEEGEIAE